MRGPATGTLTAPAGEGGSFSTSRAESSEGFAGLFEDAASGKGVLLLLLLAAFGWGALHALSPGHGKAMVAAYLVGTRGTARHAVALGATVTVDAHDRRVRAWSRHARAVAVRAAGGPLSLADARRRG